ncbi:MAG: hypothetical protein IPM63_15280 [Acidobacteriota bacterium]|nr:MAG: hypothetical protein IPM63_15280 [Acidobacteriota bacterium]
MRDSSGFLRIGGVAVLLGLAIHIVVNVFVKRFPDPTASAIELTAYLAAEADSWSFVHGSRYVAFACLVLFAAALYVRVSSGDVASSGGWGIVGIVGSALHVGGGMVGNSIEILAFLDFDRLSSQSDNFWLLFHLSRTVFTAEVAAWSIFIGGFSIAGWVSGVFPRWLSILGWAGSLLALISAVLVVSILRNGTPAFLMPLTEAVCLLWFASAGIFLIRENGNSSGYAETG